MRFPIESASLRRLGLPFAVALCAVLYLAPRLPHGLDIYDEGIRLYGAMRVLEGAKPYHDFFAYYAPAQFYWPAALFAMFGEQVLVARWGAALFVGLGLAALTVLLRRARVGRISGLFCALAVLLPMSVLDLFTHDPSLALVLSAGATLTGGASRSRLLVSGMLIGAASTFRQDFGFFGALAAAAGLAVMSFTPSELRSSGWRGMLAHRLTLSTGCLVLGILVIALPAYVWSALPSPGRLVDGLIIQPPKLMAYRGLPYTYALERELFTPKLVSASIPSAIRLWVLLAPIVASLALLSLVWRPLRRTILHQSEQRVVFVFLVALGAGSCLYAFGRCDPHHFYGLHCVTAAIVAIVVSSAITGLGRPQRTRTVTLLGLLVFGPILVATFMLQIRDRNGLMPAPWRGAEGLWVKPHMSWLSMLVLDVDRHAGDEPILIAGTRHDRVHKNALTAYFLTHRAAATYYQDFLPGFTTSAAVQSHIIEDLKRSDARVVIAWKEELPNEPNPSRTERGSTLLDAYLTEQFRVARDHREYRLLVRR